MATGKNQSSVAGHHDHVFCSTVELASLPPTPGRSSPLGKAYCSGQLDRFTATAKDQVSALGITTIFLCCTVEPAGLSPSPWQFVENGYGTLIRSARRTQSDWQGSSPGAGHHDLVLCSTVELVPPSLCQFVPIGHVAPLIRSAWRTRTGRQESSSGAGHHDHVPVCHSRARESTTNLPGVCRNRKRRIFFGSILTDSRRMARIKPGRRASRPCLTCAPRSRSSGRTARLR